VTEQLQRHFFDIVKGRVDDPYGWLTPVYEDASSAAETAFAGETAGA
jgi:hypothetical protein